MKKWAHISRGSGFTIVELLIVIVVIGILASIVIVSYRGVRERAINVSRLSEMMAWRDSFMLYRASTGGWPSTMATDTEYCLGTGYPKGAGGVPRCHNYDSTGEYAVAESGNAALMEQLKSETDTPKTGDRTPMDGIVGPYAVLKSGGGTRYLRLTMTWYGADCADGTEHYWTSDDGRRSTCIVEISE